MPAELFRSDLPATRARQRASMLPVSIVVHVAIATAVVVVPIVADGELPPPARALPLAYTQVNLPPPPPVAVARPAPGKAPTASLDKAPLEPPSEILPESAIEPSTFGNDAGLVGDAGLPTGIVGAIQLPAAPYVPPPPPPVERKPVRAGGIIEAPRILKRVQPVYPTIAQIARVQGQVVIDALIGEDGRVRNARVLEGKPMLNDAALAAVRQWVFTPTKLNGEPVTVLMTVTVVFTLN